MEKDILNSPPTVMFRGTPCISFKIKNFVLCAIFLYLCWFHLKLYSIFPNFKPALNQNQFWGVLRRGLNSLNSDTVHLHRNCAKIIYKNGVKDRKGRRFQQEGGGGYEKGVGMVTEEGVYGGERGESVFSGFILQGHTLQDPIPSINKRIRFPPPPPPLEITSGV